MKINKDQNKRTKKVTLLMHNGGRLGNQVWLIASLYAFALEEKREMDIRCFFEYQEYFDVKIPSAFSWMLGKVYYFATNVLKFKESTIREPFYEFYTLWVEQFAIVNKNNVLFSNDQKDQLSLKVLIWKRYNVMRKGLQKTMNILNNKNDPPASFGKKNTTEIIYLPPSSNKPIDQRYFYGWLFRNPVGLKKYHKEITEYLSPKQMIIEKIDAEIKRLKASYKTVVGVHIRLGDVVNEYIENDRVAYTADEVNMILREYLTFSNQMEGNVCFTICSDGYIDQASFPNLNIIINNNNAVEDLWLLSKTDIIIGADSSFAASASFLGNKPFIVFKRGTIDWEYYKDKTSYFENKYVTRFIY